MCGPGDPEGFLYRGKRRSDGTRDGDQLKLIEKLAPTGANSIYLIAIRSHGGDGDKTQNPFINSDPERGLSEPILSQWGHWFDEMDRHGIVIFFIFYDDSARIWDTGDRVEDPERDLLHALVERFEHYQHLIWVIAEEYQERYSPERIQELAAEVRKADSFDHPIAVHKLHGVDFRDFDDDPNIDQFAIQYNAKTAEELHDGVLKAWDKADGGFNLNLAEANDWGNGAESRSKMWGVAMAGAFVMVYGMDIRNTAVTDLEDCGRLVRFMESTSFDRMSPHDELGLGDTQYVLADPGRSYIAYAHSGQGNLGLRRLPPGQYRLHWLNVRTGLEYAHDHRQAQPGDGLWPRPQGIGSEVAVYLRRLNAGSQ